MWPFRQDPHVKPEGPTAFRVRVRTRSGEVVEIRLSKGMEISPRKRAILCARRSWPLGAWTGRCF
jgi:hypothetical protein